jgi:hypothetical protein
MQKFFTRKAVGVAIALAFLTACAGNGGGVPSAASALQVASNRVGGDAAASKLSGQYKGTFTDDAYGSGKAEASYAQYQNGVGGVLTIKYAHATVSASVALVVSGSSTDGTTVAGSGSLYCTFATTGTYDAKTHIMSGSYKAVQGCTGDGGAFTLKHKCYYKGNGSEDARPETGPKPC